MILYYTHGKKQHGGQDYHKLVANGINAFESIIHGEKPNVFDGATYFNTSKTKSTAMVNE